MLKPEDFIKAGYRKFTGYTGHEDSDFGLQKLISDGVPLLPVFLALRDERDM